MNNISLWIKGDNLSLHLYSLQLLSKLIYLYSSGTQVRPFSFSDLVFGSSYVLLVLGAGTYDIIRHGVMLQTDP